MRTEKVKCPVCGYEMTKPFEWRCPLCIKTNPDIKLPVDATLLLGQQKTN